MKKILLVSLGLCFALISVAKEMLVKYDNGQVKYKYNYEDGVFDGKIQAWFENGQKKMEGQYEHNFKVDTWTYWNEKGEVIWERTFYKILKESEKPEDQRNTEMLEYNGKSFTDFYKIEGETETWGKMSLRFLSTSEQNQVLFENDRLYKVIIENIESKQLVAYKSIIETDEIYVFDAIKQRMKVMRSTPGCFEKKEESSFDNDKNLILGALNQRMEEMTYTPDCFEIKEESRFNKDKNLIETKIINISPMHKNEEGHLVHLCSVYFPDLIKIMRNEASNNNDMIHLFLKREFDSELIQHVSIYTKDPLPETKEEFKTKAELEKEDQKMEIEFLEMIYKSALDRRK